MIYYQIAVDAPVGNSIYTYHDECDTCRYSIGQIVKVPFGKRLIFGVVVSFADENKSEFKTKQIDSLAEKNLVVSEMELKLYDWMASYYHYPIGALIFDCLPKFLKRPRKIEIKNGDGVGILQTPTIFQQEIIANLSLHMRPKFSKNLLVGVTGSGKTLIYMKLIEQILSSQKSVLYLIPEINLTKQFVDEFFATFNVPIYTYNSEISASEKYNLWSVLQNDENPKIVIGVRSSIFLPIKNCGLIIVDEEHDGSFKQDDRCAYHARDVATVKASLLKIPILYGTATPSLETYYNFFIDKKENHNLFLLDKRLPGINMPEVILDDCRKSNAEFSNWPLTDKTVDKISSALEKNEQVIVFVNRLGHANFMQCRACGHQFQCPNCSTNLKLFLKKNELSCRFCQFKIEVPEICPTCGNMNLLQKGYGTEKVAQVLSEIYPTKKIVRFDRDEITNVVQMNGVLSDFHEGKIDIFVGTQMISKGHNFRRVNLVVVLGVDSQLNFPDFRASEKVYQQIVQVAGRAGRYSDQGKVVIQTLSPQNRLFTLLTNRNNFLEFYHDEMNIRQMCSCPPFGKMIVLYFTSAKQERLISLVDQYTQVLIRLSEKHFNSVEVLGPRPSFIEKRVNKFTWSILLRSSDINQLHNILNTFSSNLTVEHHVSFKIDVDPSHIQ